MCLNMMANCPSNKMETEFMDADAWQKPAGCRFKASFSPHPSLLYQNGVVCSPYQRELIAYRCLLGCLFSYIPTSTYSNMIQHVSFVTSQQKENRCCLLVCFSEKLLSRHFCFQASEVNGNSKNQGNFLCHHTRSYKWFVIIALHLLWLLMFLCGMFIP